MEYLKAKREDLDQIYQLVQETIQTIYPQYYPESIVDFFCNLHSKENIAADIEPNLPKLLYIGFKLIPQIPYKIGF